MFRHYLVEFQASWRLSGLIFQTQTPCCVPNQIIFANNAFLALIKIKIPQIFVSSHKL
jgi:hypothetical protein